MVEIDPAILGGYALALVGLAVGLVYSALKARGE
jgi:hypothetical protein